MEKKIVKNAGFTLIECLLTLMILAIISAIIIVRWPNDMIRLSAEAQQLVSVMRYTQSLALSHGSDYRVNFTASSYNITDTDGNTISDIVKGGNNIYFGQNTSIVLVNLPNNLLVFNGQGIPYIDYNATVPLTSGASIRLSNGNATSSILITPETGRISAQ